MRARILVEPRRGGTYEQFLAMARVTEEGGFDAFFRSDHLMGVDPTELAYRPTDSWTTLGGLARDTHRVRLGTLLTAGTYRPPGLLAVIAASVDEMSGGRIELGLGAGWYEREHEAFGIPFPTLKGRFDRLEEALAIIKGLWTTPPGETFTHRGELFSLAECATPPRTTQDPHPPIIVGGAGPKRTPRLAAQYADEFNAAFGAGTAERYAVFDQACERIGRDPATARHSVVVPVCCGVDEDEIARRAAAFASPRLLDSAARGTPDVVAEQLAELAELGTDTVYFHIYDIDDLDHVRLLGAEVLPKVGAVTGTDAR
ncbi:MAG: TIGR03560 family F420-dependent LLM class oxidoreductase [Actinomadura sp.]